MSLIRDPKFVKLIADSLDVNINKEAIRTVLAELDQKVRFVIQDALKYMKHFRRDILKTEDILFAIQSLNIINLTLGFQKDDNPTFKRVADVWVLNNKEVKIQHYIQREVSMLREPYVPYISIDWLFIEGVVPQTPANANLHSKAAIEEEAAAREEGKKGEGYNVLIKEKTQSILGKELRSFLETILEKLAAEDNIIDETTSISKYKQSKEFRKILSSLRTTPHFNNMTPFLINYVFSKHSLENLNGVTKKLNMLDLLIALHMNPNVNLEFQLHIIIKILVHFATGERFSILPRDDDFQLRDRGAKALITITNGYETKYPNIKLHMATLLLEMLERAGTSENALLGILRCFLYMDTYLLRTTVLGKVITIVRDRLVKKEPTQAPRAESLSNHVFEEEKGRAEMREEKKRRMLRPNEGEKSQLVIYTFIEILGRVMRDELYQLRPSPANQALSQLYEEGYGETLVPFLVASCARYQREAFKNEMYEPLLSTHF
eukprot:TRINITY_DN3468_c0_g1_i2.p1 TRINITY_DN3468_c0_g1~~TRINITY_DN3468_c0_g1_i2.p1  ORF type:complete len:492 (-),score=109.66 TRINITY_DN3468_c0_g1_i2:132-1607(-)